MIGLVLDTFYPNTFNTSVYLPKSKVLERPELVKLLYMSTKDKDDEFQIELIEEGDKYVLSMFSTDDKHSLYPTEFTDKDKALSRFQSLEENVKRDFNIVEESDKSEFTNEFIFSNGGMIEKVLSNGEVIKNIEFEDNTDMRRGRYDFSFETFDKKGSPMFEYDGYIIVSPPSSRMDDEFEWGSKMPEEWEEAESFLIDSFYDWKQKKSKKRKMANGGMIDKRNKIAKVMHEFVNGELKTPQGKIVNDRKQAIAIALSEAGVNKKEMGGFIESFRIPNYNLPLDYFALRNGDMNTTTSDWELQNPT